MAKISVIAIFRLLSIDFQNLVNSYRILCLIIDIIEDGYLYLHFKIILLLYVP